MRTIAYTVATAAFIAIILFFSIDYDNLPKNTYFNEYQNKTVLFATEWCPYCAEARQFLDQNAIAYEEVDVEKSTVAKAHYEALNQKLDSWGVPLLMINGKAIRGYQPEQILAAR